MHLTNFFRFQTLNYYHKLKKLALNFSYLNKIINAMNNYLQNKKF